ncbi:hypothetical protein IDG70_08095, partial [Staphylococcus sp. EG-SA-26]|nr:hypothetical protein [Staphylococcus sp. EG-SA-26]
FEPKEQEPEFITDLSPYTNAVMQSFWVDPRTKIIYMTQARPGSTSKNQPASLNAFGNGKSNAFCVSCV